MSWIRTRDLHILTSDRHVFTADSRFELTGRDPSDWSLKVKNIRLSDAGIYECQVNTDPKMNRKVNLQVGKQSKLKYVGGKMSLHIGTYL